ncbi:MAG: leucine-rich repeat protein [Eubacterium sp.]|nr:leucine-rich repeat protein [Eubacterium sp.]
MGIDYTNKAGGTYSITGYVEGFDGSIIQKVIIKPEKTTEKSAGDTKANTDTTKTKNKKIIKIKGASYKITSKNTVAYNAPKNKNIRSVIIPEKVNINGKPYKVTSISKDAFKNCKKLKKIVIKTTSLKKIGSNAFKGINPKAKFKLPKKKFAKYKKMIKKAKAPKKATYTK